MKLVIRRLVYVFTPLLLLGLSIWACPLALPRFGPDGQAIYSEYLAIGANQTVERLVEISDVRQADFRVSSRASDLQVTVRNPQGEVVHVFPRPKLLPNMFDRTNDAYIFQQSLNVSQAGVWRVELKSTTATWYGLGVRGTDMITKLVVETNKRQYTDTEPIFVRARLVNDQGAVPGGTIRGSLRSGVVIQELEFQETEPGIFEARFDPVGEQPFVFLIVTATNDLIHREESVDIQRP